MRGFGGLTEAIDSLMGSLGLTVQPWFFPLLLGVGFLLLLPQIRQNQRTQRAREAIRQATASGGAASADLHDTVFGLASGHPTTLLVICTEAHSRGLLKLAAAALQRLEATKKYRVEALSLRQKLAGPPPLHPEAEAAALEALLDQGLYGLARNRLDRARRDWPDHPKWDFLASQIPTEE